MLLRGRRYDDMKPLRLSKMAPKPEQPFVKTKKYCMTMSTALSGGSKCNALVSEQRLEIYLPFWANIYLYSYEAKYITNLVKSNNTQNKIVARKFHSTNRFVDDLCALNDGGEFGKSHKEMELKPEHQGLHATFLEIETNIENSIFVYKLYDKRDDFPFSIVKMPYLSSNLPYNIFSNTILSEILRIARCSLLYKNFLIS